MWIPFLGDVTGTNSAAFEVEPNVHSLRGKTIFITGGDSGIGKQTMTSLALLSPAEIWLAAKDLKSASDTAAKLEQQAPDVRIRILHLNLASLASVKAAASILIAQLQHLDLLFLNAGVMGLPAQLTEDGYEYQFGVNYLGHALLSRLLLPILIQTAEQGREARVIITSSISHHNAPDGGIDFDTLKTDGAGLPSLKCYAQSKLANILFARALAERYPQLTALTIHPGACQTNLFLNSTSGSLLDWAVGRILHQPVEIVSKHLVWAAVTEGLKSGEYYEPLGIIGKGRHETRDKDLILKLWEWTEQELGMNIAMGQDKRSCF